MNTEKRLFLLHLMSKVIKSNRSKKETKMTEGETGFSDFLRLYFAGSNQIPNILFPVYSPVLLK